ncbi:MAG: hypothetical protein AABX32_00155 [Nanoarchaeota archaeon]
MNYKQKLAISIVFDITDNFIGRLPVLGTLFDIFGTGLSYYFWGRGGLFAGWEIVDISDQIDGFIPSLTIIGLFSKNKK